MPDRFARMLFVLLAASLSAVELRAQCAPPVQRLIADRKLDEARTEMQNPKHEDAKAALASLK